MTFRLAPGTLTTSLSLVASRLVVPSSFVTWPADQGGAPESQPRGQTHVTPMQRILLQSMSTVMRFLITTLYDVAVLS